MANEIVKYHNELNTIPFRKFNVREMNLFFSMISRMREQGTNTVRFDFSELRELSNYKETATERFISDLENTYRKMLSLTVGKRTKLNVRLFVLFTGFEIVGEEGYVDVKLNPDLTHILNELSRWTRFSLQQFNELHSTYSKTMFRLLKQYRTTGRLELDIKDFRELLDIPKSYKTPSQIDQKVLHPIQQELNPIFPNLTVTKKKAKTRGNKVIGYVFTFQKESKNADDFRHKSVNNESNVSSFSNPNDFLNDKEKFEKMLKERRKKS